MRGSYGIPWDIPGRIDNALNVECGKAFPVREPKLRDCAVRLRVLSAKRCLSDRYKFYAPKSAKYRSRIHCCY